MFRNSSEQRIEWHLDSNILAGDVCDAGGAVMSLRNAIGFAAGGYLGLDPGGTREMPFRASTDSRDARLGPVLPAGSYQLFVVIGAKTRLPDRAFEITCAPVSVELI